MARKILLFMCGVIALLAVVCAVFPRKGIDIGFATLRMPSLEKILFGRSPDTFSADSLMLDSIVDSLVVDSLPADSSDILRMYCMVDSMWSFGDGSDFSFPDGDRHFFDELFSTMRGAAASGRYVRVLHYGDSQIEMDRMTVRLRRYFQRLYGGGGPGLQPFHPIIPTAAVSHYCGDTLVHLASFGDSTVVRSRGNYGPMAQCFRIDGGSSASFSTKKTYGGKISRVAVLYNNRMGTLTARLSPAQASDNLSNHGSVCCHEWRLDSAVTNVRVSLSGSGDAYGVMLDGKPGVAVDNIPMRGCSGQQFVQIDSALLSAAYAQMDVALIILQFGGNSVPYTNSESAIRSYCYSIGRQIDRVHQCCPHAKILFIGPSDMSTRLDGEMQSYPCLETMIEMLRRTANSHGAAFWSIYHAMGGHNSMVSWVKEGLAGPDYIHFSPKGANIMGDRLTDAFEKVRK